MFKKPYFLLVLATAVVASILASSTWAGGPGRVMRIMMIDFQSSPTAPLAWEQEGSVALVVMPQGTWPLGTVPFAASDGFLLERQLLYNAIRNTLERNLADRITSGEITNDEIAVIANVLLETFDGGMWCTSNDLTYVAKGGTEKFWNVVWYVGEEWDSMPRKGAMAQAGPDGDVLVLGEFGFEWLRYTLNDPGYTVVDPTDPYAPLPSHRAQLVIGWFTK